MFSVISAATAYLSKAKAWKNAAYHGNCRLRVQYLHNGENLQLPFRMQFSKKRNSFCTLLFPFFESTLKFQYLKKRTSQLMYF